MKYFAAVILLLFSSISYAEKIELEKKDYLALIVSNYVCGFNEFDTSVTSSEGSVSVGIYYDISTQNEDRAKQLAKRFRSQIPARLNGYDWAKSITVEVNIYSEDRSDRGY